MKAMILAAGRGERMRPLTDHTPKPLLCIHGVPMIVYHLMALEKIGIKEIVINVSYLADKIYEVLGDGSRYGVRIHYSYEPELLETGGGIYQALTLLKDAPFIVISADIWTDYPLETLSQKLTRSAHLVMVENPIYHPEGDFALIDGMLQEEGKNKLTFANIGIYQPELFLSQKPGFFSLATLLRPAIKEQKITGEQYVGRWKNIGTAAQLEEINA